ncbi:hypothetical protein JTE90_024308 [Oedothorax gibbosus]|uniref:CWH43-like N-terminal domain-containing protein n=1 Tax=Oedothorax gibbosus TaxID=931172 RepID=A0AAV6VZZ4_9ARAC|nr:hypothetical protein JTE90_024308 [Oedothorax gibbosus]
MEKSRTPIIPYIRFGSSLNKSLSNFSFHTKVQKYMWSFSGRFAVYFCGLFLLSILVPYTISLVNDEVKPLLPSLTYAGSGTMRSGLASIGMFFTAIVGSLMISVRYVCTSGLNENEMWKLTLLNKLGLAVGYVFFSGFVILASFPIKSDNSPVEIWENPVYLAHMVGAFLVFFFGAFYLSIQTVISLFYYDQNRMLVWIRFVIFIICAVCFITSSLSTLPKSQKTFESKNLDTGVFSKLFAQQKLIASICEWILVFFFAMFFLTFVKEGKSVETSISFRQVTTNEQITVLT